MKKLILLFMTVGLLFGSEYQKWLETQQQDFKQYKKTIDDEFTDMLKKDWQAFKTMYNPTPYKKPKPKQLPSIKDEIIISQNVFCTSFILFFLYFIFIINPIYKSKC